MAGDFRFTRSEGQEHGTYQTLEEAVERASHEVPSEEGVVFWSPARYTSDGSPLHGVRAVRTPEDGLFPIEDTTGLEDWWRGLPDEVQDALCTDPSGEIDGDVLYHVQLPRPQAHGVHWVASDEPIQFFLHAAAQAYVRAVRTWR
ncbi:hypothetical protein [Brachybacterium paraconglomeratum]|uniref:hypothetical protein n=1 Tax=Brachybacterium paraconglomeratum TaxID=173362 RepID=UPI00380A8423